MSFLRKKILLGIALLLVTAKTVFAIQEPYINELKGQQVAVGNSFIVADEKFGSGTPFTLISVNDLISFEINFDTSIYFYNKPFNCSLNFKLYLYTNPSDTSESDSTTYSSINLQIQYDTVTGKPYKGIALYKFKGVYKYKVKILGITCPQLSPILPIFRLKGEVIVDRKYDFVDNSTDITKYSKLDSSQLKLEWTPSNYPGAEMFDLEYTHIDYSSQVGQWITDNGGGEDPISTDSLSKWFKNNSTRITTASSSYLINVPYDSGYILFRIRGVQIHYPDDVRWEGNWNYSAKLSSSECTSGCPTGVVFFVGHEIDLNWQYSATFAEEGKRKEVISYFDGSLRNRQSVTINNTDNKTIVQESIYDVLGRPTANILPVPTVDTTLHYFRAFNLNDSGDPYSFSDISEASCVINAAPMSSDSGASRYYSANNPFLSNPKYYYAKYIPDAHNYPFTVTQYVADNTGRILAQGGVDTTFQIGYHSGATLKEGHSTKYFYGKPSQTELDRLFGTEAGNASHYLKNMVIDPNNQISVSYVDASGKTVATALAGAVPANMHALPSSSGASVQMHDDLMSPQDFSPNSSDNTISASATFLAPVTGTYVLNYEVDPLLYEKLYGPDKDSVICSNCYYDLLITVKDNCENVLTTETRSAGNAFDTACGSATPINGTLNVEVGKIGEYYVYYELRLSQDALNFYDSVHLVKNSDIKKLNYFLLDELKRTDFYGCYSNCETCMEKLGSPENFFIIFKSLYVNDSISFTADDSTWVLSLYDSLLTHCQAIQSECVAQNVCDEKLALLKIDVSPGGQYALYDSLYNLLEVPINVLGKRSELQSLPDEFGDPDSIILKNVDGDDSIKVDARELSDSMFIANWKDSWADSLVKLHPEYCHYLWCSANSGSYQFDRDVEDWVDADTVMSMGWFDPDNYYALLDHDPFFTGGGLGASLYNRMKDSLRLFSRTRIRLSGSDKNILEFVDALLYCNNQTNGWDDCHPDSACRARNREWFLYKELYLNLKQRFYEEARRTSSNPVFANCINCNIGKDLTGSLDSLVNCAPLSVDYLSLSYQFTTPEACGYGDPNVPYANIGLKSGEQFQSNYDIYIEVTNSAGVHTEVVQVAQGTSDIQFCLNLPYPTVSDLTDFISARIIAVVCTGMSYNSFVPATCNTSCPGGVYDPYDRDNISLYVEYGNPSTSPTGTPEGYGNCQFYSVFDLKTGAQSSCKFFNVWVCVFDSSCVSSGSNSCGAYLFGSYPGTGYHPYPEETIDLSGVPNGTMIQILCDAVEVPNRFTIKDGVNPVVYTNWMGYANYSGPWGFSLNTPSKQTISFTKESDTYTLLVETSSMSTSDAWNATVLCAASGEGGGCTPPISYPSYCPPTNAVDSLYQNKVRRYPEYVNADNFINSALDNNPQQKSIQNDQAILSECRSNCEAQADYWISVLKKCTDDTDKLHSLKEAMIDICAKGCSQTNPYGTSSIPDTITATYHSFEEAIIGILGPGAINDSCTSDLLSNPYPYNKQPVYLDRPVSQTDYNICHKIGLRKQAYQASGFSGSFHQWLKQTYGNAYTLDSLELDDLLNACTNCNGILKNDILLPIVFDPQSSDCLHCDSIKAAFEAFHDKFPSIDSSMDNYEVLFTNFFNHRLGYSLTFDQYKTFLDSCIKNSSYAGIICNAPTVDETTDSTGGAKACVAELYATALTNATNTYLAYIDSVHKDFRNAWMTKCLNVQPSLKMDAELYEYHYTLYYYDQSGNLVKTIPPEGVDLLDSAGIDSVKVFRQLKTGGCYKHSDSIHFNNDGQVEWAVNSFEASPYTVEMMINPGSHADQVIVSKLTEATVLSQHVHSGFVIQVVDNKLEADLYGHSLANEDTAIAISTLNIDKLLPDDQWTHLSIEQTGDLNDPIRIFINGAAISFEYSVNSLPNLLLSGLSGSAPLIAGSHDASDIPLPGRLVGTLKNLRVYNRLLSADELRQNAFNACQLPSNSSGLLFWSPMTDATNDTVPELVTRAPGILTGFTWTALPGIFPQHGLATTYQYNSLNQVLQQYSPDGDTSQFFYDRLGRLIVSQNKEQKENASYSGTANRFSYTQYDALGRIKEVGEKSDASVDIRTVNLLDTNEVKAWIALGTDRQVTKTIYDNPINLDYQSISTSRKRVIASIYLENKTDEEGDSTLYGYDILGNVKTLVQHIKALVAVDANNGKKRVDYDYDLVSGKVNMVSYQSGKGDQFFYKYLYDADNRVVASYSSRDQLIWTSDASYSYYLHGPLARTELGQYKVQGVDYAYTLQGWLKGINSDSVLSPTGGGGGGPLDMANDGRQNTTYSRVSRDVYGFKLGYYTNDYTPIGGAADGFSKKNYTAPGSLDNTGNQLFNGNISYTTLALSKINNAATTGYSYGYDQLNRLVEMRQHATGTTGGWSNSNISAAYRESIAYDANGNILKYLRNGTAAATNMDSLNYKYDRDGAGHLLNNKLNYVTDNVSSGNYAVDIDNQATNNYKYDLIGNLKRDSSERIDTIRWTVYGKINKIVKNSTSTRINYGYDAGGNRTTKIVSGSADTTTFYVRDAQGNTLAVYAKQNTDAVKWSEQDLYGSSRLGLWRWDTVVATSPPIVDEDPIYDSLLLGSRTYEVANHLGNVLATISDKKIGNDSSGTVNYYLAEVLSQNDYYPFGMMMLGRRYDVGVNYRYGFNGKENDNEVKGEGNEQDYGMRVYDPRLGRFLSVDPMQIYYSHLTPYQFASNGPISNIDLDGLERYYFIFNWNEKTGYTFLKTVTQTHEAGFWNGVMDDLKTNWGGTVSYERMARAYNGDVITKKEYVYVIKSPGGHYYEAPNYAEMKKIDLQANDQAEFDQMRDNAVQNMQAQQLQQAITPSNQPVNEEEQVKTAELNYVKPKKNNKVDLSEPEANIQKVNGRNPLNFKYAGKTFTFESGSALAKKYPNGVRFNEKGFPDFSPYARKTVDIGKLNKATGTDFDRANKAAGFANTPAGFTWHHVENSTKLQLVPTDLHEAVSHTGGRATNAPRN